MSKEKIAVYTVAEASNLLKLHRITVQKLLRSGELRGRKVGRKWLIPADAITSFFEKQEAAEPKPIKVELTKDDVLKVLKKEPALVDSGIYVPTERNLSKEQRENEYNRDRDILLLSINEIRLCCEWLSMQKRRKTINTNSEGNSYNLKHVVEKWGLETGRGDGYVSNGALIAAAIHMGFEYEGYCLRRNVQINISSKFVGGFPKEKGCFV